MWLHSAHLGLEAPEWPPLHIRVLVLAVRRAVSSLCEPSVVSNRSVGCPNSPGLASRRAKGPFQAF